MHGGDKRGAELQHSTRLEDIDEPTLPTPTHENEIDMQEVVTGVKRRQSECLENLCNGKLRRKEGTRHYTSELRRVQYQLGS